MSLAEFLGQVGHFIQYHNPDRYGPPRQHRAGDTFWVMTRKQPERLPGNYIWLIGGQGHPRRYYLRYVYRVDHWQPVQGSDFFYQLTGRQGVFFQPDLEITGIPWFDVLKRRVANFSLGLTRLSPSEAALFIALARGASLEFCQAETHGWLSA